MATLAEFWPTVPSLSSEQLKAYAVVMPTAAAKDYLFGQDGLLSVSLCRCEPRQIRDGSYIFNADLLREWHPSTRTGLYADGYDTLLDPIASTITVDDWAATIAELPPAPPDADTPVEWQSGYQVPGASHPGYPRGTRVTYNSTTYTSLCDWNTWTPGTENGLTWAPPRRQNGDPWQQPQPGVVGREPYTVGEQVTHNGALWDNTHGNGNVWEPGVFGWTVAAGLEPTPDPAPAEWVQPVPGTTARPYMIGEKAIYNGQVVRSKVNDNVWSPEPYPAGYGWEVIS